MHISDGVLSIEWCAVWFGVSAIFIALGLREIKKRSREDPKYLPTLAMMGAAVFVIAVWHIPVPVTGSCSHPVGTPMAAIVVGPFATVVISFIALIFHAFLAHGGITTLGANTFSMGIVGTFSGYLVYKSTKGFAPLWLSAGLAGFIGDLMTYVTSALELALSLNPTSIIPHWIIYMIGYAPTQIPLAIAEFAFTAGIIDYVAKVTKSETALEGAILRALEGKKVLLICESGEIEEIRRKISKFPVICEIVKEVKDSVRSIN